jgi:anti-sigma B factor antagonist
MAAEALVVKQFAEGSSIVLEVSGRLDAATVALAQDKLAEAVTSGAPLVIDLAGLEYISSVGLRLILKSLKQAQAMRLPFAITGPRAGVKEVLDSIGLAQYCPIFATRAEALTRKT